MGGQKSPNPATIVVKSPVISRTYYTFKQKDLLQCFLKNWCCWLPGHPSSSSRPQAVLLRLSRGIAPHELFELRNSVLLRIASNLNHISITTYLKNCLWRMSWIREFPMCSRASRDPGGSGWWSNTTKSDGRPGPVRTWL